MKSVYFYGIIFWWEHAELGMPFKIFQKSKFCQNGAYDYIALTWRDISMLHHSCGGK